MGQINCLDLDNFYSKEDHPEEFARGIPKTTLSGEVPLGVVHG